MSIVESIFTGCNRNLGIFDYNEEQKIIAYGSSNTVSISSPIFNDKGYDINTQVQETLNHHSTEIATVKWLQKSNILISGCQDGIINLWKCQNNKFKLLQGLKPTVHSISTVGLVKNDNKCLDFIVGDSKGFLYYYAFDIEQHKFVELSKFELPYGYYAMSINLIKVSENEMFIATGGSKPIFNVLTFDKTLKEFQLQSSIPGHDDWVRSIDSKEITSETKEIDGVSFESKRFIIATSSLDRIIRLWKLTIEDASTPVFVETNKLKLLTSKEFKFETQTKRFVLSLDAILMGHDDWVSDISWKSTKEAVQEYNQLQLLSSSADSSIMIWQPDSISGVWFPEIRLGEIAIKGASTATGSSGGFYCSRWIFDESTGTEIIMSNGKTGSFRCWVKQNEEESIFDRKTCFTGPIRPISDITWSKSGDYILATSLDQSTRLYAKFGASGKWFEFGRPQIHGYDMIAVKSISDTRFVSGGDEKVIRVFDMPKNIANMLHRVGGLSNFDESNLPEFASLPVLGLSNKASLEEGEEEEIINNDIINNLNEPPVEDILQRHTLWPEIEKLYGHGFEITTLDVSNDGKIISSACRSNVSNHAVIRNFSTETWLECKNTLAGHDLTITRLRYSLKDEVNKDEYLLAVSRDRKFSLWLRNKDDSENFKLINIKEKAHSRIIWDCAWVNFKEHVSFVTVSRDKEVRLWKLDANSGEVECKSSIKFEQAAVTAIDSVKIDNEGNFKLVIGLDNGDVYIYLVNICNFEFEEIEKLDESKLPGSGISRISISSKDIDGRNIIAIGSKDNSLRVLNI